MFSLEGRESWGIYTQLLPVTGCSREAVIVGRPTHRQKEPWWLQKPLGKETRGWQMAEELHA